MIPFQENRNALRFTKKAPRDVSPPRKTFFVNDETLLRRTSLNMCINIVTDDFVSAGPLFYTDGFHPVEGPGSASKTVLDSRFDQDLFA